MLTDGEKSSLVLAQENLNLNSSSNSSGGSSADAVTGGSSALLNTSSGPPHLQVDASRVSSQVLLWGEQKSTGELREHVDKGCTGAVAGAGGGFDIVVSSSIADFATIKPTATTHRHHHPPSQHHNDHRHNVRPLSFFVTLSPSLVSQQVGADLMYYRSPVPEMVSTAHDFLNR
jgi:hypothetical protein